MAARLFHTLTVPRAQRSTLATKRPPCRSGHLGIIGGAEAAFWRLAWIILAPRVTCTNFRNSAEGREESGPPHIPMMLRAIWTGVRMSPQGKPHQPNPREKSAPPSWLLTAQERQQTCWELLQLVRRSADQTRWTL